jgi:hypothetical protein
MNPADVMTLPLGLLREMEGVLRDEDRAQRRAQAKARARGR